MYLFLQKIRNKNLNGLNLSLLPFTYKNLLRLTWKQMNADSYSRVCTHGTFVLYLNEL